MTTHGVQSGAQFETGPMITSAVFVGLGGLLAFIGVAIGALHALSQGIRWYGSLEHPPNEIARAKWAQVKAAGAAGANGWSSATPSVRPVSAPN